MDAPERDDVFAAMEETITATTQTVLSKCLTNQDKGGWIQAKASTWTGDVIDGVLKELEKLEKPFKYCVTCMLMQRNGAGAVSSSASYFDAQTDGGCSVTWETMTDGSTPQNIHATVSIFAFSIHKPEIEEKED